jgi:hypothetical protein
MSSRPLVSTSSFSSGGRSVDYEFVSIEEECPSTEDNCDEKTSPPCFSLLQQFYDELMIPTFPLEEERDDINDWFECFRLQMKQRHQLHEQKLQDDIKQVLTDGFKEEGIAAAVQNLSNPCVDEDCEFDGPAMDVVLMILDEGTDGDDDDGDDEINNDPRAKFPRSRSSRIRMSLYGGLYAPKPGTNENAHEKNEKCTIIGGAAVEYYKQSRVGLLSYIVLKDEFRGCCLARYLHEEALSRLENLANVYGASFQKERNALSESTPLLQAVFAETNTAKAGDVTPEQSLLRHNSLYNLGYRLVSFPYAQPPLTTEDVDGSFDDILLLTYFPFDDNTIRTATRREAADSITRFSNWFSLRQMNKNGEALDAEPTVLMDVNIPFLYIEDFYQSVFGYERDETSSETLAQVGKKDGIPDYRTAKYYKLAHWFTHHRLENGSGGVVVDIGRPPWNDCKEILQIEFEESK